jgi:bifunctional non-homologous end joining protein LigD
MPRPASAPSALDVGGRRLAIRNLDRVLYPRSGTTKAELLDYYVRIADAMLPHLRDRLLHLHRYPEGVEGPRFWQKECPDHRPGWLLTAAVHSRDKGRPIHYCVANELAAVVWAANIGSLELHTSLHRVDAPDHPTAVAFDLDPGEGTDVLTCAQVALWLKKVFDGAGLESFVKVSGSKGMQVYVPLNTVVTYEKTQRFAKSLAERMQREHPESVVSDMAKAKRAGKVLIDWSQNSDFKTTVSVYSLRAKRDEPYVSMPVSWAELRRAVRDREAALLTFTPEAALARLAKIGDLWSDLLTLKQKLPREAA